MHQVAFRWLSSVALAAYLSVFCYPDDSSAAHAARRPASNSLLAVNHDGTRICCSNRDSATVAVFQRDGLIRQHEVKVGLHPEGTTFVGNSNLIACCVYGDDQIAIVDSDTGTVEHRIDVFDEPYGIVSTADGAYLFVTLEYPGQVVRIRRSDWSIDASWNVGQMLRGLALVPDGSSLFVTEYLTANVLQISTKDGRLLQTYSGASTDNLARQIVVHPSQPKVYLPHVRSRVTAAHGDGSIFPYVSVVTVADDSASRRSRIPMDSFRGARVVANPWEVAVSPDGGMLYVIFGGTNDLYVAQVEEDDYQELSYAGAFKLGSNPRAVRVTPDNRTLLVYNALDFELVSYQLPNLREECRTTVTDHPLTGELLLGKKLFYTALPPMSRRLWISCSSCHIDGDADGRTWQQPEGLRQTQPLHGLAWTHPLHWSADRDEVQDFEHTIRGQLMQGRGLLNGELPDALAASISGRSRALDALAVYTTSHKFTLSPHAKQGLSEAACRGQRLFASKATKCAECHSGAYYCDSQQYDVGTGEDDPSELMGPAYETPTLLGTYRSGPYLHHGRASTLQDVLTTFNASDRHGVTSHLTDAEIEDLVEFLKALPFENPEPAARAAGLRQVRK